MKFKNFKNISAYLNPYLNLISRYKDVLIAQISCKCDGPNVPSQNSYGIWR